MPWNAIKEGMASTTVGTVYNALSGNLRSAVDKLGRGYVRSRGRYNFDHHETIEPGPNKKMVDELVRVGKLDERKAAGIVSDAYRKYWESGGPELKGDFDVWLGNILRAQGVIE